MLRGFRLQPRTKVVIDVTGIKDFEHDSKAAVTSIGAGHTNWSAAKLLFKEHNLQLPAGSCYSVGLGGHVTGGGYGLSSRAYGLTVDYVCGFEVIVFDAKTVSSS